MAEPYVPVHAVTYETTPEGPVIARDQVVTAESDTRPPPAPSRPLSATGRLVPRPERPADPAPAAAAEKGE